jgi:nitrous oxide reductase accessory protein NosL
MRKILILAMAAMLFAAACNKSEETAPPTAPAESAAEASPTASPAH